MVYFAEYMYIAKQTISLEWTPGMMTIEYGIKLSSLIDK